MVQNQELERANQAMKEELEDYRESNNKSLNHSFALQKPQGVAVVSENQHLTDLLLVEEQLKNETHEELKRASMRLIDVTSVNN